MLASETGSVCEQERLCGGDSVCVSERGKSVCEQARGENEWGKSVCKGETKYVCDLEGECVCERDCVWRECEGHERVLVRGEVCVRARGECVCVRKRGERVCVSERVWVSVCVRETV